MLAEELKGRPAPEPQGAVAKALRRLLMRRAQVVEVERIADRFHLVTLSGPALRDVAWVPGQKLQVAMGASFMTRTYTPIDWDGASGHACILGYAHGNTPGSMWLRGLRVGDQHDVLGPRGSLDLRQFNGSVAIPIALFGDETSIGLAHALVQQDPARVVTSHFEVDDVKGSQQAVARLGIRGATLHARTAHDAQITALEEALSEQAASGAAFVLTGKAGTIQRLRQQLKREGVPSARIAAKAYWAPGKSGLD